MRLRLFVFVFAVLSFSSSALANCALEGSLSCPARLGPGVSGTCTYVTTNTGATPCSGTFGTFLFLDPPSTLGVVSSDFYSEPWTSGGSGFAYNLTDGAALGPRQSFTVTFGVTAPPGGAVAPQISVTAISIAVDDDSEAAAQTEIDSFIINAEEPPPPPPVQVAVTRTPKALLQSENVGGAAESLSLTNNGTSVTPALTLSSSSDFFTLETTTLTLQPGETRTIGITGRARPAGAYEGVVTVQGTGQNPSPTAQVRLLSTTRPDGPVDAAPAVNRVDVAAEGPVNPSGIIPITNRGTGTLRGILSSDVPWITPQSGLITIPPGATVNVTFVCERGKRSPSATGFGSAIGSISLTYDPGTPAKYVSNQTAPPSTSRLVTVVDTVRPAVIETLAPPLRQGEVALFAPGVGRVQGSVGLFISDVSLLNVRSAGGAPVNLFYKSLSTPSTANGKLVSIASLPPLASLSLGDVVKGVFGSDGEVGSLQIRTFDPAAISVGATIFVSSDQRGTFGTSVPVFRSDRGASAGQKLHLTGLRKGPSSHTNLYLQEMTGNPINVVTSFFNAGGGLIGSPRPNTIDPFGTLFLSSPVEEGAVTARLEVLDGSTGRLQAYATPVDDASKDFWSVADWSSYYNYGPTEPLIIPIAGNVHGALNSYFRTDVSFTNRESTTAQGFLRYHIRGSSTPIERAVSLPGLQSISYEDVVTTLFGVTTDTVGYLLFTPTTGNMAVTSRTYTTVVGQAATFGTGVPALPLSSSLNPGDVKRIGGLEDSSLSTIGAARPGTFRTNVGIVETGGSAASVKVTARFTYSAGTTTARIAAPKTYELSPRQFLLINNITRDILGASRETTFGDIRNMALDFEVTSQSGSVVVFTSATDNGTNDTVLRTE